MKKSATFPLPAIALGDLNPSKTMRELDFLGDSAGRSDGSSRHHAFASVVVRFRGHTA